jgi:uncharacterized protein (TIGR00369 family)
MPASRSTRPTPEQLAIYAARLNGSPTFKHFHVKVSFPDGDKIVAELDPVSAEHRGGMSGLPAINGGVLAALFDLVIGCAPALVNPHRRSATVQLSMSFEKPVFGDRILVEGKVDRAGQRTVFASAFILNEQREICARCQGIAQMAQMPWPEKME